MLPMPLRSFDDWLRITFERFGAKVKALLRNRRLRCKWRCKWKCLPWCHLSLSVIVSVSGSVSVSLVWASIVSQSQADRDIESIENECMAKER